MAEQLYSPMPRIFFWKSLDLCARHGPPITRTMHCYEYSAISSMEGLSDILYPGQLVANGYRASIRSLARAASDTLPMARPIPCWVPSFDTDVFRCTKASSRAFISLFYGLWSKMARPSTARAVDSMYTPRLLSDCEKEPQQCVDISQTHLHILAALKRRDAADVVFEAKVMALLDPVKKRLTEMTGESVSIQGAHVPELTLNPETAPDLSPAPQIFYGREQELSALVGMFSQETQAHTVLLGQDGAGKSALALTLLHHADIVRKFGVRRYLVRCDTSKGSSGIRSRLASVLGLSHIPEPAHRDVVLSTLASCPFDTLFVLDDLEHVWTPPSTRLPLESLLADLAAIPSVSLLLTMRGTQRPLGPKYTRSNLPPLGPLPLPAARALFRAISDLPALVLDEDIAPVDFSVPPLIEVDTPPVVDTLVPGVSNAELAIVDTLLHRAERFPGPVVHFAQRAQYEPLSFLLAYSEDDDV